MQDALYSEGEQNGYCVVSCCVCPLQWSELRLTSYAFMRSLLVLNHLAYCCHLSPFSTGISQKKSGLTPKFHAGITIIGCHRTFN